MDKNSIIGFLLIAVVFFGFFYFNKPSEAQLAAQKRYQDSVAMVQKTQAEKDTTLAGQSKAKSVDTSANFVKGGVTTTDTVSTSTQQASTFAGKADSATQEQVVTLQNDKMKINFSSVGGQMISAELKNYTTYQNAPLYLFNKADASFDLVLKNAKGVAFNTQTQEFQPILSVDKTTLTMRHAFSPSQYIDFVYQLKPDSYMMKFDIHVVGMKDVLSPDNREYFQLNWASKLPRQEKGESFEERYSGIFYKFMGNDVKELSAAKDDKKDIQDPLKWISFKNQYFATTLISDYSLSNTSLASQVLKEENYIKNFDATFYSPVSNDGNSLSAGFRFYIGPAKYSLLKSFDKGIQDKDKILNMDEMVPLGWTIFRWVNQYFVIPLFNILSSWGLGMGIIIFLMTIIVKLILAPLTFKSFMSSAKMRVLRPQIQAINDKYPNKDQMMERQKATMDLYGRAGVNPMSGCLPMLLPMPILLALYYFFPSSIELRHQSFLWAHDLSAYDAIFEWKTHIPYLSDWYGNHVSLFCLLFTVVNIVYMKFSMDQQDTGQQQMPGMKWMMYFMPVMMFFWLNSFPSGLNYYYFVSTLFTILLTVGFRYFVNEEKLLAKLEANKKKPKKKSGFMARLEELNAFNSNRLGKMPRTIPKDANRHES